MATPKKKVSRSRRNMRRFAGGNRMDPVTYTTASAGGDMVRPHTVTLDSIDTYLAARKDRKAARKTATA